MQIDLDDELYKELKEFYEDESNKIEYPNFRNLINKVLKEWISNRIKKKATPEPKETGLRTDFGDRFKEEKKEA